MLTKFETKSHRVKGIAFHPVRPWVLASLHTGLIQLWDYQMETLLDRFDEHEGPVRGVDFHRIQPLIVSGGDDYKIKIWDYKLRRCLFTLLGHLDYIRTVQFHPEYPWIVTASDDQTIRIWNWQSRTCISVLTGHNHYVMCASFHPKDDLVVSASLDQTVRVWDTSGLRQKTVKGTPSMAANDVMSRVNADLFGNSDVAVKYVLEGHDRGVNWANFHPTLPLIVSGADDRQVKLWRMNETKAWEVDTLRGHTNNVSCVMFLPKYELIISNSEDRSIRVWDVAKRMGIQTFRRENDRFWVLAVHPEQNLIAAGHDSGITVFKLERERPAFTVSGSKLFFVREKYLRMHEFGSTRDVPVLSLRRAGQGTSGLGTGPKTLLFNQLNPGENNILVFSDAEGGSYELVTFSSDGSSTQSETHELRKGSALSVAFVARKRFAVLDKNKQILIKNLTNEVTKKIDPPQSNTDGIFYGGSPGCLLLRSDEFMTLFDQEAQKVIGELQVSRVRYVVWSEDYSKVALIGKHTIIIANRQLEQLSSFSETVRIKSGAWDSNNKIFVYATPSHIKYCLENGDSGTIRSLDIPVYVTKVRNSNLYCLDRECKTRVLNIDVTEAMFKLALEEKRFGDVIQMVKNSNLCGQSVISFLQEKGYPEVALHFVQDKKSQFKLALACGNLEIALNAAIDLGDDECWIQLGTEALRQGNYQIVDTAHMRTKSYDRLSFLYLISGNRENLQKMLKIADMRHDSMGKFHNALYLGDVETRVKVLEDAGQFCLAYLTAATYGLTETANKLNQILETNKIPIPEVNEKAQLLIPPTPILRSENWPLLAIYKGVLDGVKPSNTISSLAIDHGMDEIQESAPAGTAWGVGDDDDDLLFDGESKNNNKNETKLENNGWNENDLELDIDINLDDYVDVPVSSSGKSAKYDNKGNYFNAPQVGQSVTAKWFESSVPAEHVAGGSVETCIQLLNRQIVAVNFNPMKQNFIRAMSRVQCVLPGLPLAPTNKVFLCRNATQTNVQNEMLPRVLKPINLLPLLKQAYQYFFNGNFDESLKNFVDLLRSLPLVVADTRTEENQIREYLETAREYITAIRLKQEINIVEDPIRQIELTAYSTHCNLQPGHILLVLRLAMRTAFKHQNFITSATFARRLLELPDVASEKNAEIRIQAQKVVQKSEQMGRNQFQINYDERNPFVIDCKQFEPIYRGSQFATCAFCGSAYSLEMKGNVCLTCDISIIGVEALGLVSRRQS